MTEAENLEHLDTLARLVRYYILISTTQAGSGHPTSALSATDLMVGLMFSGQYRYFVDEPDHPNNDRLIFSKGHASPLLYSLWAAAGQLTEEDMRTYRHFDSVLEGHPTPRFRFVDAATGSLGQGLSIGVGMAINGKYLDKLPYRTYVLLGDSEMAEGAQWEAIQLAAHYGLDNLCGVVDVNGLGQRGQTLYGHDLDAYERRISAFGWHTVCINGHSPGDILLAYRSAAETQGKPTMILARTVKGKGVADVEDQNGWHGKALSEEQIGKAIDSWGPVDKSVRGKIAEPADRRPRVPAPEDIEAVSYPDDEPVATRDGYGNALSRLYPSYPTIVALDGEVSNSTRAEYFRKAHGERFFEMYITEQNMAGVALGLSCLGKIPFASSFAAFWARAFDQIRMGQYSGANIKFVGSHAGVSIGQDGPSQMGLEDIAMFRTLRGSAVLHPCDAVSMEKLVEQAAKHQGCVYLRSMRQKTPIVYGPAEEFPIGGCKVLKSSQDDAVAVVAAGQTVHEALAAWEILRDEGISIRVIDLYSVKPVDEATLVDAAEATRAILTVEDHYPEGGLGEAVRTVFAGRKAAIYSLAVTKVPRSGRPAELRDFEEISARAIAEKVRRISQVAEAR